MYVKASICTKVLAAAHKTTLLSGKFLRVQKVFWARNLFKQGNKRLWLIWSEPATDKRALSLLRNPSFYRTSYHSFHPPDLYDPTLLRQLDPQFLPTFNGDKFFTFNICLFLQKVNFKGTAYSFSPLNRSWYSIFNTKPNFLIYLKITNWWLVTNWILYIL